MDLPFWALNLRYPTSIEAEGPPVHAETTATRLTVRYEFPKRGTLPPVTLTWRNGRDNLPPLVVQGKVRNRGAAVLFVGEQGMLQANYTRHWLLPESQFADFQAPEPTIPDSLGHHREWIAACKTGAPTTCNFDYSGPLTETVLLGNVAYRAGQRLQWDADKLQAIGCAKADPLVRREYRAGWTLG
jgi:hypothetical protein